MPAEPDFAALDRSLAALAHRVGTGHRWLLAQTLATGSQRRALLSSLTLEPGGRLLDLGCGFGIAGIELAMLARVTTVGLDVDSEVLAMAAQVAADLRGTGALAVGSEVAFLAGDCYDAPFASGSFDAGVARFLFQHLDSPAAAASELARLVRPGGTVCVVDVDDGLSVSFPPPSSAYACLAAALAASQASGGGDRQIGRKVAGVLDSVGLQPTAVVVLPQAAYHRRSPGDPERRLLVERMLATRTAVVAAGALGPDEFDSCLETLASEDAGPVCEIEGHVAVVARRR